MKKIRAWYFAPADLKLRYGDNREIKAGITHTVKLPFINCDGETYEGPRCCCAGLHGSINPLDALGYGESSHVYRVELSGVMDIGDDKISAEHRRYIWGYDATDVLNRFARLCALDVIGLRDAPEVITRYLKTGDESLRAAASAAARAAAGNAAWDAVREKQNKRLTRMLIENRPGKKS